MSADDLSAHVMRALSPSAVSTMLETDVVLVADVSSQLIGFVQFGPVRESPSPGAHAELRRLYVQDTFQSQGIGSRLMNAALAHPVLAEAETVSLDVWEQNEGAQRFYSRYGFRPAGTRPFTVASGAETTLDIIMVRIRSLGSGISGWEQPVEVFIRSGQSQTVVGIDWKPHSRRAITGSTRVARRAGRQQASRVASSKRAATPAKAQRATTRGTSETPH